MSNELINKINSNPDKLKVIAAMSKCKYGITHDEFINGLLDMYTLYTSKKV